MIRLIRKALSNWRASNAKRRLYRAYPELHHFDRAEIAALKSHGRVNDVRAARQACMTELLRAK